MTDFLERRERERKLEKIRGKLRNGNSNGRGRALGAFDFDAPRSTGAPPSPSHYKATDAELLLVQRSVRAMFLGPEGRVYPSTAAELAAAKTLHAAGFIALLGPIKPGASWESAKGKLATKPSKLTAVLPTNPGQELIATPHANRRLTALETSRPQASDAIERAFQAWLKQLRVTFRKLHGAADVSYSKGAKYWRVYQVSPAGDKSALYFFDPKTGDIYGAAGWKKRRPGASSANVTMDPGTGAGAGGATTTGAKKKAPRKKCPPAKRKTRGAGTYDPTVTDKEHMPKKVAATFAKGLKKAIGRGSLVCIDDARSTATRGWDYGFAGTFDITLPDGAELRAMLVLHRAAHPPEVSGNVQLDAEYGGVIALARGLTWDGVLKSLIEQTGSHLKAGASK